MQRWPQGLAAQATEPHRHGAQMMRRTKSRAEKG